jgi:HK97 family phage prohead protease
MFDRDTIPTQKIVRDWTVTDIRAEESDGKPRITGHAAMFNTLSVNLGSRNYPWFEKIRAGAFAKTIREADIRSLWQHDVNFVLGRNKTGTLRLWEDEMGLAFEAFPPETDLVRDLVMAPIKRGDVDQMSFLFDAVQVNWIEAEAQAPVREVVEARLYEVSPVTFPAYTQTDVNARAALAAMGIELDPLTQAILRADNGKLAESDRALVASVIDHLQGLLPSVEPPQAGHSDDARRRQRALELAEAESFYKE